VTIIIIIIIIIIMIIITTTKATTTTTIYVSTRSLSYLLNISLSLPIYVIV